MANVKIDPSHIIRSEWKDVHIPDTDIYTFVFNREQVGNYPPPGRPDRVAFIDAPSGKKITFAEISERVKHLSRGFSHGMNIKPGERVCFYMPNHVSESSCQAETL